MRCGCLGWFESTMLFDALYFISTIVIIKLSKEVEEGAYMQKRIRNILKEFEQCMRNVFKEDFCKILVYGSYARGDYNENSDVDVMILVNTPLEKINSYYDQVSDCAFDFMMKYGVDISPVIKNVEHFNYWKDDLPYYHNVLKEGVAV